MYFRIRFPAAISLLSCYTSIDVCTTFSTVPETVLETVPIQQFMYNLSVMYSTSVSCTWKHSFESSYVDFDVHFSSLFKSLLCTSSGRLLWENLNWLLISFLVSLFKNASKNALFVSYSLSNMDRKVCFRVINTSNELNAAKFFARADECFVCCWPKAVRK